MRNPSSDMCLDTLGKKDDAPLGLYQCHGQGGNQVMKLATSLLVSYSEGRSLRKQLTFCDATNGSPRNDV